MHSILGGELKRDLESGDDGRLQEELDAAAQVRVSTRRQVAAVAAPGVKVAGPVQLLRSSHRLTDAEVVEPADDDLLSRGMGDQCVPGVRDARVIVVIHLELDDVAARNVRADLVDPVDVTAYPQRRCVADSRSRGQEYQVRLAVPVRLGVLAELLARLQASGMVVVTGEVLTRAGDAERDDRDVSCLSLRADDRVDRAI